MKGVFATFLFFVCAFSYQIKASLIRCAVDVKLNCPSGYFDGCEFVHHASGHRLTNYHVCIDRDEVKTEFFPCKKLSTFKWCTPPQKLACFQEPPVSDWHICFLATEIKVSELE